MTVGPILPPEDFMSASSGAVFDTPGERLYKEWDNPFLPKARQSLSVEFCQPYIDLITAEPKFQSRHVCQVFDAYTLTSNMTTVDVSRKAGIQIEIVRDVTGGKNGQNSVYDFVREGYWAEGRLLMIEMVKWPGIDPEVVSAVDRAHVRMFGLLGVDEWGLPA